MRGNTELTRTLRKDRQGDWKGEEQKSRLLIKATLAAFDLEEMLEKLTWSPAQRSNEFDIAVNRIRQAATILRSAAEMGTTGKELVV